MSCSIIADRKSQEPNVISKYEVIAHRSDVTGALGPLEFELERKSILTDYEELLPAIMSSSIRFRSALKFNQFQEETIDILTRIGEKIIHL